MGYLRSDVPFIHRRDKSLMDGSTNIIVADIYIIVYEPPNSSTRSIQSESRDPTNDIGSKVRENSYPQGSWFRRYSANSTNKLNTSVAVSHVSHVFPLHIPSYTNLKHKVYQSKADA